MCVLEAACRQALGGWGVDPPTRRARSAKLDIVEKHNQDIRCAGRRLERCNWRELRIRVLRIVGGQPAIDDIWNRQNGARRETIPRNVYVPPVKGLFEQLLRNNRRDIVELPGFIEIGIKRTIEPEIG